MGQDDNLYYGDFEADGEPRVRENVALGRYLPKKKALALEWLRRKDEARADASSASQMEVARSAKDAAWDASFAAREANAIAKAALAIAAVAAIIAIVAIALPFLTKP